MASAAPSISLVQTAAIQTAGTQTANRRDADRFRVLMPGTLTILDGVFDCAIEDVSATGARFVSDVPFKTGQEGILLCQQLEVLFSVVWTDRKSAGVKFEEEVPLGVIRTLRWHNDRYRDVHNADLREIIEDWAAGTHR